MTTEAYDRALAITREHHATRKTFSGRYLSRYLDDIRPLIEQHGVKTILDYGCGKAEVWKQGLAEELGVKVTLYDPGVAQYDADPVGTFDMVICTQALGSIPVDALPWVVGRLFGYARTIVYVGERLGPVRKKLHAEMVEEGVMPHGWTHEQWRELLTEHVPNARTADGWLRTNDRRTHESKLELFA